MRLKSERILWQPEIEELAKRLANKNEYELIEIFEDNDVVEVRTMNIPRITTLGRVLSIIVWPMLAMTCFIKWVFTGNSTLDGTSKRSKMLQRVLDFTGIK